MVFFIKFIPTNITLSFIRIAMYASSLCSVWFWSANAFIGAVFAALEGLKQQGHSSYVVYSEWKGHFCSFKTQQFGLEQQNVTIFWKSLKQCLTASNVISGRGWSDEISNVFISNGLSLALVMEAIKFFLASILKL